MNIKQIDGYIKNNFDEFINDLKKLLAQPSISATGEGVKECTDLVQNLCKDYGFDDTQVIETSGQPSVVAKAFVEHEANNDFPTLLIYGHYDVQPVDPSEWETPPFEPDIREGPDGEKRIYARGAGDNKGQWFAHLCAVKTLREIEDIPMNLTLILEGEEESASPNFQKVVSENKDLLDADVVMVADGPIDSSGRPHIFLGARGWLNVELNIQGPNRDLHSGLYGGPVPNPAWELVKLLDTMKDENGKIAIEGFYDDVQPVTEKGLDILNNIPFDLENTKKDFGIKELDDGPGDSYFEKIMYYPTLNIQGLTSGYQGEGIKTVLPSKSRVKIDMRLVVDQDPEDIYRKFKKHVKEHISEKVKYEISRLSEANYPPHRTPLNSVYIKPILEAVKDAWASEPILKPVIGGSWPGYVFTDILGLHCILVPYANKDENNHSPNENLSLSCFEKGIKTTIRVLNNLSIM